MVGLTVVDVVEGARSEVGFAARRLSLTGTDGAGSALEALAGMTGLVAAQPKGFSSVEKAIEWQ